MLKDSKRCKISNYNHHTYISEKPTILSGLLILCRILRKKIFSYFPTEMYLLAGVNICLLPFQIEASRKEDRNSHRVG